MGNTRVKSFISWVLVVMLIMTLLPTSWEETSAASKMSLDSKSVTITKGMTQQLSVLKEKSGATFKWSSEDKTVAKVSKKGIVKGVKDGSTTIKCVVTANGKKTTLKCPVLVKTPKFSKKSYTINLGKSATLSLKNKYKGASYKWISSDKKIVKVNSKGKISGVAVGKVTVSVKVMIPAKGTRSAKTITQKVSVKVTNATESGEVEVATQEELVDALSNTDLKKITIKTEEKTVFTIPEGEYLSVELLADAPKADIVNNGVFKSITIKQIAEDTWTENAKGNVLVLDAAAGHVVIPDTAGISEIRITNANSNFKLDVQGSIEKIIIDAPTKVEINVTGTVGSVDVNSRATVSVEGTSESAIAVNVAEGADGAILNSNVKMEIQSGADTEINLSKGAEGSTVQTTNASKSVEVTNNTATEVVVKNETGKSQTVSAGKNATVDGGGNVTGSTTGGSAGSGGSTSSGGSAGSGGTSGGGSASGGSSGGASSSGNLSREVISFESIKAVEAGVVGTRLKTVDELVAQFPTTVSGNTNKNEKITYQVVKWENTDNYSPEVNSSGYYTFTATLGNASAVATIKDGVKATVKVWVKPAGGEISYINTGEYYEEYNKFELVSYEELAGELFLKLKYAGEKYAYSCVYVDYYDEDGDLIKQEYSARYNSPNMVSTYIVSLPKNSSGQIIDYKTFAIRIKAYGVSNVDVQDKLIIGTPTAPEIAWEWSDEIDYSSKISIRNTGKAEIKDGMLIVYFWKGTEIVGYTTVGLGGIVGSETTEKTVYWEYQKKEGQESIVPDGVTVEFQYAYINGN